MQWTILSDTPCLVNTHIFQAPCVKFVSHTTKMIKQSIVHSLESSLEVILAAVWVLGLSSQWVIGHIKHATLRPETIFHILSPKSDHFSKYDQCFLNLNPDHTLVPTINHCITLIIQIHQHSNQEQIIPKHPYPHIQLSKCRHKGIRRPPTSSLASHGKGAGFIHPPTQNKARRQHPEYIVVSLLFTSRWLFSSSSVYSLCAKLIYQSIQWMHNPRQKSWKKQLASHIVT